MSKLGKVSFSFQSKDRPVFTRESIISVLANPDDDFSLIWCDGSSRSETPAIACDIQRIDHRVRSVEFNVTGGPDAAIQFALKQQLEWDHDWVGLIENDVVLHSGWFPALRRTIELALADNVPVGAASVRGYQSRVLEYRHGYSIDWAVGAGMVLFTRAAAQLIVDNYHRLQMSVGGIYQFYAQKFNRRIHSIEWPTHHPLCTVTLDFAYAPCLYHHGLYSVGAIPSYAHDLQFEVKSFLGTDYVTEKQDNLGHIFPEVAK